MTHKGIVLSLCDFTGAWSAPFIDRGYTVVRVDPMHDAGRMTTEGTTVAGSMAVARMADGGYSIAATARQLADMLAGHSDPVGRLDAFLTVFGVLPATYQPTRVVGVLMAPPCTAFAGSGARWWKAKDADGRTEEAVSIVIDCWRVMQLTDPLWWALENPVGRLERLVPELQGVRKFIFDPCDFAGMADDPIAEAYTKRTCLWGEFTPPHKAPHLRIEPHMVEKRRRDGRVVRGSWMWATLGGKSERTKALRSKTPVGFARAFAMAQEG